MSVGLYALAFQETKLTCIVYFLRSLFFRNESANLLPATVLHIDMSSQFERSLANVSEFLVDRHRTLDRLPTRPTRSELDAALRSLPKSLPDRGLGAQGSIQYLLNEIVPGLSTGHAGNRYFGLVTGGVTEGAQLADMVATSRKPVLSSRPGPDVRPDHFSCLQWMKAYSSTSQTAPSVWH